MIKICLDAGHYGKYNQSPAVKAYYESDMTWKLHLLLKTALEGYGFTVYTTRSQQAADRGLFDRGYAAKGCDLFLSLHSNAVGSEVNETVDYVRVYHLVEDDTTDVDEISREVAEALAPVIARVMGATQGGDVASRRSPYDHNKDGVLNDNYYGVLNGARQAGVPGCILEHSFHTNTKMANWLLSDDNLQALADAEAATLAEFFGMEKETAGEAAEEPEHWYRIRRSWEDRSSQVGAYKNLALAKKNCPEGYSVYDWNGEKVYPEEVTVDYAASYDKTKAGTYTVRSDDGLNLRTGAGVENTRIENMPDGSDVRCYGYYTG